MGAFGPSAEAAGPDGNIWFTESNGNGNRVGRITMTGVVTEFGAGISAGVGVWGITAGADGAMWFTEQNATKIGRISTAAAISPPTIAASFGAASIAVNGSTSLGFSISNTNRASLSGIGFGDALPSGLVIATPNGLTGSCGGGSVVATAGSSSMSLSGATLAASSSCSFSVNVAGTSAGVKNNVTTAVTSVEGGSRGTTSASVTVTSAAISPPTIYAVFSAGVTFLNTSTSLSFTLSNPNSASALTGVGFSDTLLAGLTVANPNGLSVSCGGGSVFALAGSGSVFLSGPTLAPNALCSFSVNGTGVATGTQQNTDGPATSVEGGSGSSSTTSLIVISAAPTPLAPIPTLQQWAVVLLSLLIRAVTIARRKGNGR